MKHISVIALIILALSGCTITKKYHSFGYQIDWKKQSHIEATAKRNSNSQQSNAVIANTNADIVFKNKTESASFKTSSNAIHYSQKIANENKIKFITHNSTKILKIGTTNIHHPRPIEKNDTMNVVKKGKTINIEALFKIEKIIKKIGRWILISLLVGLISLFLAEILFIYLFYILVFFAGISLYLALFFMIFYGLKYLILLNKYKKINQSK